MELEKLLQMIPTTANMAPTAVMVRQEKRVHRLLATGAVSDKTLINEHFCNVYYTTEFLKYM